MVDNSGANWTGPNAPSLVSLVVTSYIFDNGSFNKAMALADYANGDFYIVSGFWHRSAADFGMFADGSPRTEPLPTTGSATYKGDVTGYYWTAQESTSSNFNGDVNIDVSFDSGDVILEVEFDISTPVGSNIKFDTEITTPNNMLNEAITDNDVFACGEGCTGSPQDSRINTRFVGNPVNIDGGGGSDEWPAGIIGAFGAIHSGLCLATGEGEDAFCSP